MECETSYKRKSKQRPNHAASKKPTKERTECSSYEETGKLAAIGQKLTDNTRRSSRQLDCPNGVTNKPAKKSIKTCRFLACALNISENKNTLVIIVPKNHNDNAEEILPKLRKGAARDWTSIVTRQDRHKEEENHDGDHGGQSKRMKRSRGTKLYTTCHLPKEDPSRTSTWIVCPRDALPNIDTQHRDKMYQHIEIHVKPLLVLDINGILCHRVRCLDLPEPLSSIVRRHEQKSAAMMDLQSFFRKRLGRVAQTDIIPRTDLVEFLDYLAEHYSLAIWSSAKKKTVKFLMKLMFPNRIQERLVFVWGQERCECISLSSSSSSLPLQRGDHGIEYKETEPALPRDETLSNKGPDRAMESGAMDEGANVIFMKHLSKVWNEFPLWNTSNTLLVDDSPEKCLKFKENSIHPPPILGLDIDVLARFLDSVKLSDENDVEDVHPSDINMDLRQFSDEYNQTRQMQFFQDLATAWKDPSGQHDGILLNFLKNRAQSHMNWNP